jgi:nucleotide-binding universal stress UspA family protein
MPTPPVARIVLATDLTPRCDRAAQRATALARQWGASLHLITVLERSSPLDEDAKSQNAAVARTRMRAMESLGGFDATVTVLLGRPEDGVVASAGELAADLIVTGPPAGNLLTGSILGGTIASLMRHSQAPVLVVKRPGDRCYRRVVVALDLSDASRTTIKTAQTIFSSTIPLVVFHAFGTPFRLFAGDVEAYEAGIRDGVTGELRDALKAWSVPNASDIPVVAEYGDPAVQIRNFVEKNDMDVVVTGTHGRSGLLNVLLGSVAEEIVRSAGCDILIVPVRTWQE